jgi:hypothetical protein
MRTLPVLTRFPITLMIAPATAQSDPITPTIPAMLTATHIAEPMHHKFISVISTPLP